MLRTHSATSPSRSENRLLDDEPVPLRPYYHLFKRACEIGLSLVGIVALAPAGVVLALAVKLSSPGPAFYRQERVGRDGRCFLMYKFRTLLHNAESETGAVLTSYEDRRVTPLGRFLRACHIDEIPQMYNVLRGEMSFVGPRPERPCFVEAYSRYIGPYPRRHAVRPGLTGLAQINAGYLTHAYVKLHYDLDYVQQESFWLDLQILWRTPGAILKNLKRLTARVSR